MLKRRRASMLTEFMIYLGLLAILSVGAAQWSSYYAHERMATAVAAHTAAVKQAAQTYIERNFNVVYQAASSGPIVIPILTLQSLRLLPTTFNPVNSYGQTVSVLARVPSVDTLEVIVSNYGGRPIPKSALYTAAQSIGPDGGVVDSARSPGQLRFTFSSTTQPIANFSSGATAAMLPTDGRLVARFTTGRLASLSDFLYREAVPGAPEANRMNTNLDLSNNDITNVGNIAIEELSVANTLNITGGISVTGTLTAAGGAAFNQVDVAGSANIVGDVLTSGDVTLSGNLVGANTVSAENIVAGTSLVTDVLSAADFIAADQATIETVLANAMAAGTITADDLIATVADIADLDAVELEADNAQFNAAVLINAAVTLLGDLYAQGQISASSLQILGNSAIQNLIVSSCTGCN